MTDGEIDTATVTQLIRAVEECKNYAFLIGAGTSRPPPAEILTGGELIDKWQEETYNHEAPDAEFDEWVEAKEEEKDYDESRYGFWFEERHPTRGERRERIQELVKDEDPNFEHVILASLMAEDYIPHTLTPNFDDLLFKAFYLYLEDKPQVIDHRAVAPEFRLTHSQSAIVKLHGDYLYDNLRNTAAETGAKALDEAMKDALQQTVEEYGLVVVGYSGEDESIMNPLIEADLSEYGIYWCTRDSDSVSEKVGELLEQPNTYLVEIEGFGSLMRKFGNRIDGLEPPQPDEVIERAEQRADMLKGALKESKEAATDEEEEEYVDKTEKLWEGQSLARKNQYEDAIDLYNEVIEEDPEFTKAYNSRGSAKRDMGEYEEAITDFDKAIKLSSDTPEFYANRGLAKQDMGEFESAITDYNKASDLGFEPASMLNSRAEARIALGDLKKAQQDITKAKATSESIGEYAVSLLLDLIIRIIRSDEIADEEMEYRSICEDNFATGWKFKTLDSFIDETDIEEDKKEKIAELTNLLREHKDGSS